MLIPLIYLISGWRWALFTSDVPLLGKADERTGVRERRKWTSIKKRTTEAGAEWLRFPGPGAGNGWSEVLPQPLSAVMRPAVVGPLIVLWAPPCSPVSGARARGIQSGQSLNEAPPCPGPLIE